MQVFGSEVGGLVAPSGPVPSVHHVWVRVGSPNRKRWCWLERRCNEPGCEAPVWKLKKQASRLGGVGTVCRYHAAERLRASRRDPVVRERYNKQRRDRRRDPVAREHINGLERDLYI